MTATCVPCRAAAQLSGLPPRERIVVHEGWRLVHSFDSSLPGWLCLLPLRHVEALSALEEAEAAALGPLLAAASGALEVAVGCAKTYVVLFAERAGYAHLHFHVVPRSPDLDAADAGPGIFRHIGRPEAERLPVDEMDRLALALRAEVEARL